MTRRKRYMGLGLSLGLALGAPASSADISSRLMFASTRLSIPSFASPVVSAGFEVQYSRLIGGTPDYAIQEGWVYFPWWRRQQNALVPTEINPGNGGTVRASLIVGSTVYPIDFGAGAAAGVTFADGGGQWVHWQTSSPVPANSALTWITESQVPLGGIRIGLGRPYTNLTEGIVHSATPDTGYLDGSKTPTGAGGSGFLHAYGPSMVVAKGWDGRAVVLIIGNSIAFGSDDSAVNNRSFDPRGAMGYLQRGLDSLIGGRLPFGIVAVPGMTSLLQDTAAEIPKTLAMLEDPIFGVGANYRPPFSAKACELGVNNFDTSTGASRYPSPVKTNLETHIAFWNNRYPDQPFIQTTLTPRANSTALYNWTDPLQQTPVGTDGTAPNGRWAFNDDLLAGNIAGVTDFIDVEPYFSDPTNRDRWATGLVATTLSANVSAGANTVSLPVSLELGENACFDPGVVGAENRSVLAVSGSGPYTHTLSSALTNAHSIGSAVLTRRTTDGVHPNTTASILASQAVIDAKLAGKFS